MLSPHGHGPPGCPRRRCPSAAAPLARRAARSCARCRCRRGRGCWRRARAAATGPQGSIHPIRAQRAHTRINQAHTSIRRTHQSGARRHEQLVANRLAQVAQPTPGKRRGQALPVERARAPIALNECAVALTFAPVAAAVFERVGRVFEARAAMPVMLVVADEAADDSVPAGLVPIVNLQPGRPRKQQQQQWRQMW
jgi:hypothetical protein